MEHHDIEGPSLLLVLLLALEDGRHESRASTRAVRGEHEVKLVLHSHELGWGQEPFNSQFSSVGVPGATLASENI